MMSSALRTPARHTYTLRKRRHTTPVPPVTDETATSPEIDVSPDYELPDHSDGIPTDCNSTSKGPGRVGLHNRPAGADLPHPDASSAAEARQKRISSTSKARQLRLRHRHVSSAIQNDRDAASASHAMPPPSSSHASLLLALAEASVSHPDETNCSIADEENENSKMRKELGAGQGGKEQETVMEGRPAREMSFKMDAKVLDCNICFSPLKPPFFQCEFGHVLCALCFEKLPHKCVICCKRTGYSRCFALEQVINAIRVPCSNRKYGCDEFITRDQKEKHESLCTHAPCFCPEDGCSFIGSTVSLRDHFVTTHGWLQTNLQYKKTLRISIARNRRFALFVGEDLSMFLLINILTDIGNALTLVCIRPQESEPSYSSKISAVHRAAAAEGRLVFQMDPLVASSALLGGVQLRKFFLLVPPELVDESTDELTVNILIDELASKSGQGAVV